MAQRWLVVGSGIAGIVASWAVRSAAAEADITVVERAPGPGGLLSGEVVGPENTYFDCGTHIFRETGVTELDRWMMETVPPDDLIVFPLGLGDLAGSVFGGRLQTNSHFPDLRMRPDFGDLLQGLVQQSACGPGTQLQRTEGCARQAIERFGRGYWTGVLRPILAAMYQVEPEKLAAFGMLLPGLTRVVAHDFATWHHHVSDDQFRNIFAVPDQRLLPDQFRNPLRSFYSRRGGTRAVIDALCNSLKETGVKFRFGTNISRIDFDGRCVLIAEPSGVVDTLQFDRIVFAVGAIPTAKLLGHDTSQFGFDRPISHRLIHLLAADVADVDLFYFYGLDPSVDFYRVTNYRAFSKDSDEQRVTVEVLGERAPDDVTLVDKVVAQLSALGFLRRPPRAAHVTLLANGFPVPTVRNLTAMSLLAASVGDSLPDYAVFGGIGARPGLFFQSEVMVHMHETVKQCL